MLRWGNFGEAFVLDNCSACHAATAADRHGAPDAVVLDTVEELALWRDRVAARAADPLGTMPPAGGVSDLDRALLDAWLRCDPALTTR